MIAFSKNWWKILLLSLLATIIDIAGHIIEGTPLPNLPLSIISKTIGIRTTVVVYFIIWFSLVTIIFIYIEKWLKGSKVSKGLKYGISLALVMYLAVCETNTILGTPVIDDIRMGFADAIPIIILGLLSGKIFAKGTSNKQVLIKMNILTFLIISSCYVIGRYFAYSILKIESGYFERPVSTLIWTLSMGISFGIMYLLIGRDANGNNPLMKASFFGFLIVGPILLFGNLFFPLLFKSSVSAVIVSFIIGRSIVDMLFITIGYFLGERLMQKQTVQV